MAEFVFVEGTNRARAINLDNILEANALSAEQIGDERNEPGLEITRAGGSTEIFYGVQALELWISVGLADLITDGDGKPTAISTPFGNKPII